MPSSITNLYLGNSFNISINSWPESLIELGFSASHSKIINNIPENVECINIYFNNIKNDFLENIPCSVKKIKIDNVYNAYYLKKIPFGCVVTDDNNNVLNFN